MDYADTGYEETFLALCISRVTLLSNWATGASAFLLRKVRGGSFEGECLIDIREEKILTQKLN